MPKAGDDRSASGRTASRPLCGHIREPAFALRRGIVPSCPVLRRRGGHRRRKIVAHVFRESVVPTGGEKIVRTRTGRSTARSGIALPVRGSGMPDGRVVCPANPCFPSSDDANEIRKKRGPFCRFAERTPLFSIVGSDENAQVNSASTFFITSAGSGSIGKTTDGRR